MSGLPEVEAGAMPLAELRSQRMRARRAAELARLRGRTCEDPERRDVERLGAIARALTDELILRYAADPSLVDALLEPDAATRPTRGAGVPA